MLIERHISSTADSVVLFLLFFIVFSLLVKFSGRNLWAIVASFFSAKALNKKIQEEYFIKNYPSAILLVLSSLVVGSNVYLIFKDFVSLNLLAIFLGLFAFLGAKLLSILILSKFVSVRDNALKPVYYVEFLGAQTAGIVFLLLMPLIVWVSSKTFVVVFLSVLAALVLYKWLRQFLVAFSMRISLFYNILYFCALELIPVLYLIKQIRQFI